MRTCESLVMGICGCAVGTLEAGREESFYCGRSVSESNFWLSCLFLLVSLGGVTNGHDLMAEYLRENYPAAVVNTVLGAADVTPRALEYDTSATRDSAFFMWQIVRAIPSSILRMLTAR